MRPRPDKHILIVEDDQTCRVVMSNILAHAGYRVTLAGDFFKAMEIVESQEPIDLLLADIVMPAGTPHGITLSRIAQLRRRILPVLFVSGAVDPTDYHVLGPNDGFLRKPFAPNQLVHAVDAAVA